MKRSGALVLLLALVEPRALLLLSAIPGLPTSRPAVASSAHHHPPGCPWQGTPECPHAHHGPSSGPAWSPCAELPLTAAGQARLAWAPPVDLVAGIRAPAPSARDERAWTAGQISSAPPDVDLPPPKPVRSA
jgi:hypothetical protein